MNSGEEKESRMTQVLSGETRRGLTVRGCFYKGSHLGRNFQKPLSTWPCKTDHLFYNSQLTDHYATINLDDQMLRKVPGCNGQNIATAFLACHGVLCTVPEKEVREIEV